MLFATFNLAKTNKNFGSQMTNGAAWKFKKCSTCQEMKIERNREIHGGGATAMWEAGGGWVEKALHILQYLLLRLKTFCQVEF